MAVPDRSGRELLSGPNGNPVWADGLEFWGLPFISPPGGAVVRRASTHRKAVLVVECDLQKVRSAGTHWPFLRDRRIDAYQDLVLRYRD